MSRRPEPGRAGYASYALADAASKVLPRSAAFALAGAIAPFYSRFLSDDLSAIGDNLAAAVPGASPRRLTLLSREVISNYSRYLVELLYSREVNREFIDRYVEIDGLGRLDRALAGGRGAIVLTAHLGNWEMAGYVLSELGYKLTGIAARHADDRIEELFRARRARHGVNVVRVDGQLRGCYDCLKRNEVLALLGDRLYGSTGESVNFLGRDLFFPQGPARIRRYTKAPVVPAFFVRGSGKKPYRLEIQEPLEGEDLTRRFAGRVEAMVRRVPTEWFLFQRFWEAPKWPV